MKQKFFGQYLVEKKIITEEQLREALKLQKDKEKKFGEIAVSKKYLTEHQVNRIHYKQQKIDKLFGKLAVQMGYLSKQQVDEILNIQNELHLFLGEILISNGFTDESVIETELKKYLQDQKVIVPKDIGLLVEHQYTPFIVTYVDFVLKLFKRLADIGGKIGKAVLKEEKPENHFVSVFIEIKGSIDAVFVMSFSKEVVIELAEKIFGQKIEDEEMAIDGAGEFLNIVCGNVATAMSKEGKKITIGVPEVIKKGDKSTSEFQGQTVIVPLLTTSGYCEIQVFSLGMQKSKTPYTEISKLVDDRKSLEEVSIMKDYAVEASLNGIAFVDLDGTLIYANNALLKMWGYDAKEEIIGKKIIDFWESKERANKIITTIINNQSWLGETKGKRKDGTYFPVEIFANLVLDKHSKPICFMASLNDISARKKAEQELITLNQELEGRVKSRTKELAESYRKLEIEKEKAENLSKIKSNFISTLSHEIRTPLNAIINFLNYTLKGLYDKDTQGNETKLNERQKDKIGKAFGRSIHLLSIIDHCLDLHKIQAGSIKLIYEHFFINDVIKEVSEKIYETYLSDKIDEIKYKENFNANPKIHFDKSRFKQIMRNLLSNAAKFTEKGEIEVSVDESETEIVISVKDTGIGIEKAEQETIFKEFELAKKTDMRKNEGTGLGLPITKQLVNLMNAEIFVDSKIEEGATFTIVIPK